MSTQNTNNYADHAAVLTKERIDVPHLRETLKGRVIVPGDPDYDQARKVFYSKIDAHPALIARPAGPADVSAVIALARESGLELAVRSGGHSGAGHSTSDGGIVLDLRDMRALQVDVADRTAWAETGLTTGAYTAAVDQFGLATGFGDTGSVGIGGITLGGGIGYLVRKHGLTIDSLLAADLITADGQLRRIDAVNHPDLFWAIRGGGGNFGIATRFQYRLHELGDIMGGMIFLPAEPEVIAGFIEAAEAAPEELSTIANVMTAPPMPFIPAELHGKLIIMGMMVYAGSGEAAEKSIAPFRKLARPLADMLRPMRYPEMFPHEEWAEGGPKDTVRTMFLDSVDRAQAEKIVHYLQTSDSPMRVAQLRVLGGAMARVPTNDTAFAHRQSRIMGTLVSFYNDPAEVPAREAWLDDFSAALRQSDDGQYVNFQNYTDEALVRKAYPGQTWQRLAEIKARYDPTNLFHRNQNVPPA